MALICRLEMFRDNTSLVTVRWNREVMEPPATGLLILLWMISLFLRRSSWRHQVSEFLVEDKWQNWFCRTGRTSLFSRYSQSGVVASHADSVLGPCGWRETVCCPPFSFCFLPLSSGRHSLWSLAAQHLLSSAPFQTVPAGVCAGEKSELVRVEMWGLSSCWGSPPGHPLFPPLCVPAALWASPLSAGGSHGKIYVLGHRPFTGCKSGGGWFLSGVLFPSAGGFFFVFFAFQSHIIVLCGWSSHKSLEWNHKFRACVLRRL